MMQIWQQDWISLRNRFRVGPMTSSEQKQATRSPTYRVVTAAFGVLFTFIAIVILAISELTVGPVVATLVIGILGIDAIVSAYRKTTSLLSRIGPLP